MPAARQGGGGAAAGVRQSESSRGADLVAKVRQKLVDDQLLEELGEEPFTMEVGDNNKRSVMSVLFYSFVIEHTLISSY